VVKILVLNLFIITVSKQENERNCIEQRECHACVKSHKEGNSLLFMGNQIELIHFLKCYHHRIHTRTTPFARTSSLTGIGWTKLGQRVDISGLRL
jgi:hypothetical protein